MPTQFAFRTVAAVAIIAFVAGCLAAVSQAQEPVPPQRTLVAVGTGQASVKPADAKDNASILKAVEAAEDQALPRAIADAKVQAQKLATAAGVTLGPIVSVSNTVAAPVYGPFFYGSIYGSFGPNKFCGTIHVPIFRTGKDGRRHRVGSRTRRVCRFPHTIQRQAQLTYALA